MIDRKVSVSLSVPCTLAWTAWAAMLVLLGVGLLTEDVKWGILGLAASTVAATLHVRCFAIRVNQNIRNSFALLGEGERVTRLHSSR